MEAQLDEKMAARKNEAYRKGVSVIILLVFFTLGEFLMGAVAYFWGAAILGIALLKALLVVREYMHIGRLFSADEEVQA